MQRQDLGLAVAGVVVTTVVALVLTSTPDGLVADAPGPVLPASPQPRGEGAAPRAGAPGRPGAAAGRGRRARDECRGQPGRAEAHGRGRGVAPARRVRPGATPASSSPS